MAAPASRSDRGAMSEDARIARIAARRATEARVIELAGRQHGVITRGQLLESGVSRARIAGWIDSGRIVALHRGVYGFGPFQPPRAPLMAAILACGPSAVLSHRSAASMWQMLPPPPEEEEIEVTVRDPLKRRRPGVRVHRAHLDDDESAVHDGVPITAPLRTVVDLAAVVDERDLERAIAYAERERLATAHEISALPERYEGWRDIRRLQSVLGRVGGPQLTRSAAERRFLALIRRARLPIPRTNARVGEYEVDFLWPDHDLAVEVDGYRFHGSRVRFESDRRRGSQLAALGLQVVSLTWRQIVDDEVATAVELSQALTRARRAPD